MSPKLDSLFDAQVFELIQKASADPDSAAELLIFAAEYMRLRKQLPDMLADYLAAALESSALKPRRYRAKQLTDELHLTANNRRKFSLSWVDAYELLRRSDGKSQNQLSDELAHKFNVSRETARSRIRTALKYLAKQENLS